MLTWIERIRIGMPPMIRGTRVGDGPDLGGQGIDLKGDPDHDRAVVIGTGEGRGDRRELRGAPLKRPGEVHPAHGVKRVGTGAGGDVRGADLARGRAARGRLLGQAGVLRGCGDRCLGAVGDPAQITGEAGWHREVEVAQELVAVVAVELQVEVAEGSRSRDRVPATRRGWKGRFSPGQGVSFGPVVRLKNWVEVWSARLAFQGKN